MPVIHFVHCNVYANFTGFKPVSLPLSWFNVHDCLVSKSAKNRSIHGKLEVIFPFCSSGWFNRSGNSYLAVTCNGFIPAEGVLSANRGLAWSSPTGFGLSQ